MPSILERDFKNTFTENFPGDKSGDLSPRQTPGFLYSKAQPTPVREPSLLAWSYELANDLAIDIPESAEALGVFAGNTVTSSMYPYAACYAGHQFGNWAGQLGDGRAITLGEWENEGKLWELQLKGAGPTPYSRRADGRAVLRSSVREYLMSEAMFYLGVPTTRALSLVATGEPILRDMFYNGNAAYEQGAIVMRVAPSFLRFGNYEILAARNEIPNLKNLINWTVDKHYPHLTGPNKTYDWFKEIVEKTATMVVEWMRIGFVHGVMNTDNMSILGLTIDFGPYSFLDDYDPNFTPNTTDLPGRRYAYGNQPYIAHWNLIRLANAIVPAVEAQEPIVEALNAFKDIYSDKYNQMMANKLGFDNNQPDDAILYVDFENMLRDIKPDMTIFYQLLISLPKEIADEIALQNHFITSFYENLTPEQSLKLFDVILKYKQRLALNKISSENSKEKMKLANPRFILRNYMLHAAIEDLENGEGELFVKLQEALKEPYSNKFDEYFTKRPDWAKKKAGCSMLSCSS
jgi:serine/tyrosine/threonine adenylyltransferase